MATNRLEQLTVGMFLDLLDKIWICSVPRVCRHLILS